MEVFGRGYGGDLSSERFPPIKGINRYMGIVLENVRISAPEFKEPSEGQYLCLPVNGEESLR